MFNEIDKKSFVLSKAILIIFVIISHCLTNYNHTVGLNFLGTNLSDFLYTVEVPCFFILSGLLCRKQKSNSYIQKKAYRILIPLIFFSGLKFFYSIVLNGISVNSVFNEFMDSFIYANAYWFGIVVLVMYFLAPLLWSDDNVKLPKRTLILLIVLIVFNSCYIFLNFNFLPKYIQIENLVIYFPFFIIGMVFRKKYNDIIEVIDRYKLLFVFLSVLICSLCIICNNIIGIGNLYLIRIVTVLAFTTLIIIFTRFLYRFKMIISMHIGAYSWQLMLLESFYRTILFSLLI